MEKYIVPELAMKKLKVARSIQQPVYIYSPTGFGKTTLIKKYLANRKYTLISCAEEQWSDEKIAERSREGGIIVFDDIHLIRSEDRRQILELLDNDRLWVILAGRCKVQPWLAGVCIQKGMVVITEELLRFDDKRTAELMAGYNVKLDPEQISYITRSGEGNPFVLCMTARMLSEGNMQIPEVEQVVREKFGQYLENNVFSKWDRELLEFLMQVSVVDEFDAELAEMITGGSNVVRMIELAEATGSFIRCKNGIFSINYCALDALRHCAALKFGSERIKEYCYNAGLYYEMHDRIPEALAMYERSGRENRIQELLVRNARRNPGNGHYFQLRKYYFRLKEEDVENNAVLMSGLSMLYSMMMMPDESEKWYAKLKEYEKTAKGSDKREAQSRLLFLDISLSHRGSANILHILRHIPVQLFDKCNSLPEFSVTSNLPSVINGGKDFCQWTKHDREIVSTTGGLLGIVLGRFGKGTVNVGLAESLFEKGNDNYEVMSLISRAEMETMSGGSIEIAFVAAALMARLYLVKGEGEMARLKLNSFEERVRSEKADQLLDNVGAMNCLISLYTGDSEGIKSWLENGPDENLEFNIMERFRYLTKVRCYLSQGEEMKALPLLVKMRYYCEYCHRTYMRMEINVLTAIARFRTGGDWKPSFLAALREASSYGFIRVISSEGAAVSELLRRVAAECTGDKRIDNEWLARLINETDNMARLYPEYLRQPQKISLDFSEKALAVLRLQAEGLSVPKIAEKLGMKPETVKYHTKENYRKLNVSGKTDAVLAARRLNLI